MTSVECSEGDSFKGTDLNEIKEKEIETKKKDRNKENGQKQRETKEREKEVLSKSDENKTFLKGDISKSVWSEHE